MIATMTSRGQITFPKAIRDQLHLEAGDKFEFTLLDNGQLLIIPVTASIENLKGILPAPNISVSLEEMDEAIAQGVIERVFR